MPKLSSRKPDPVQPPQKVKMHRDFWRAARWMTLLALVCVFGVLQTELYVSLHGLPVTEGKLRQKMEADREKQNRISDEYFKGKQDKRPTGLVFDPLFAIKRYDNSPDNVAMLEDARKSLVDDPALGADLTAKYGVSLQDVNALIIPAWHLQREVNKHRFGLTEEGWKKYGGPAGSAWVKGFTIRDRVGIPNLTEDGIPRIILNYCAFRSKEQLRLTLLHEMLHALNVPGHYPCFLNLTQSDLLYLPEYRTLLEQAGLKEDSQKHEYLIWLFLILLPFTLAFYQLLKVLGGYDITFRAEKRAGQSQSAANTTIIQGSNYGSVQQGGQRNTQSGRMGDETE